MIHTTARIFQVVGILGCLSSSIYYLICLWSALLFLREHKTGEGARPTEGLPPVSILKPLKGTDPDIYECFRSHCLQDYPEYEIVFGVSDADDPAVASVQQLKRAPT
jgi:ceramide glucosyltransferase